MKLSTVKAVIEILSGIKINRITNKEIKTVLINDYLYLRKFVKGADEERRELLDKFKDDWKGEFDEVARLREQKQPVVGHDAFVEAERDTVKAIVDGFDRDVETTIKSVPLGDFITACDREEELTLEQIDFLQEVGLLEG